GLVTFKNDDLIASGSTRQTGAIGFAQPLTENLHRPSDKTITSVSCRRVNYFQQILVTRLFHTFVELMAELGCRSFRAGRVTKNKRIIELHSLNQIPRLLIIVLSFPGKPDNYVSCQANLWPRGSDLIDQP